MIGLSILLIVIGFILADFVWDLPFMENYDFDLGLSRYKK